MFRRLIFFFMLTQKLFTFAESPPFFSQHVTCNFALLAHALSENILPKDGIQRQTFVLLLQINFFCSTASKSTKSFSILLNKILFPSALYPYALYLFSLFRLQIVLSCFSNSSNFLACFIDIVLFALFVFKLCFQPVSTSILSLACHCTFGSMS